MGTGDTAIRKGFADIRSMLIGEPLELESKPESLTPGPIVAEFNDPFDANMFRRLKGADTHSVTAGVHRPFAVRKLVREVA